MIMSVVFNPEQAYSMGFIIPGTVKIQGSHLNDDRIRKVLTVVCQFQCEISKRSTLNRMDNPTITGSMLVTLHKWVNSMSELRKEGIEVTDSEGNSLLSSGLLEELENEKSRLHMNILSMVKLDVFSKNLEMTDYILGLLDIDDEQKAIEVIKNCKSLSTLGIQEIVAKAISDVRPRVLQAVQEHLPEGSMEIFAEDLAHLLNTISAKNDPILREFLTSQVRRKFTYENIKAELLKTDNEEDVKKLIGIAKQYPGWNPNQFFFWGKFCPNSVRSPQTLKLLLENGADPLSTNEYGALNLIDYCVNGSLEHLNCFISAGVTGKEVVTTFNVRDLVFFKILDHLTPEQIQLFLDNGYSLELKDFYERTPLETVLKGNYYDKDKHTQLIAFFLSKGVDASILETYAFKNCSDIKILEMICDKLPKEKVKGKLQKEISEARRGDYQNQDIFNQFKFARRGKQKSYEVLSKFLKKYFSVEEAEVHAMAFLTFREYSPDNYLDSWHKHPNRLQLFYQLVTQYPLAMKKWCNNPNDKEKRIESLCNFLDHSELSTDQVFLFAPYLTPKRLRQTVENVKDKLEFSYLNNSFEEDGIKKCPLKCIEEYLGLFEKERSADPMRPLVLQNTDSIELAYQFQKILHLRALSDQDAAQFLKKLPLHERCEMISLAYDAQKKAYAETLTLPDFLDARQQKWSGKDFHSKVSLLNQLDGLADEEQVKKFKAIRDEWFLEKLEIDINFSKKRFFFKKLFDQIRDNLTDKNFEFKVQSFFEEIRINTESYQNKIVFLSGVLLLRELVIDPPQELICEISKELMVNPYICKKTGHHFEYTAIESWILSNRKCPFSREPRLIGDYEYSPELKGKIENWKREQIFHATLRTEHLKDEIRLLADKNNPEEVKRKKEITQEYNRLMQEKISSIPTKAKFLQTLASKTTLKSGTRLYHCSSKKKVGELLSQGLDKIKFNEGENSFSHPQMGKGLYLSTEEPAYLSEGRDHILVLEVIDDINGYSTIGIEELLSSAEDLKLSKAEISGQYEALQRKTAFLRQEGLHPKDTEMVMGWTESRIKIVGYAQPPYFQNKVEYRSIEKFCLQEKIQLHDSWKPIEEIDEHPDHFKLKKNNREIFFKFMRKDAKRSQIHEICGSLIAHEILGPLVPKASKFEYRGKKGIAQKWIPMRSVSKTKQDAFDPSKLTSVQLEQFIAHWLVDRLIGNNDNHSNQFGIGALGNVIGFDKGSAFKNFEAAIPFMEEKADELFSAYENIRQALRAGKILIDFNAPIIVKTLQKIENLTLDQMRDLVMPVAKISYSGTIDQFIQDVYENSRKLLKSLPKS